MPSHTELYTPVGSSGDDMGLIDVTEDLSEGALLKGSGNGTNNATYLNTALPNRNYDGIFFFPGGRYDFTDTIDVPERAGCYVLGASFARNFTSESAYLTSGAGGIATRWCWMGNATDPQIDVPGWGTHLENVRLEALPTGGSNRANVGIHYRAQAGSFTPGSSHLHLRRVALDGHTYGILLGRNATDTPDGSGDYTSDGDNHSDNFVVDHLWMREMQTAGIWVRNDQACGHSFGYIAYHGNGNNVPLFHYERGGSMTVEQVQLLNAGCQVLKIGKPTSNQGSFHINSFRMDATAAADCNLLTFDNSYAGYRTAHAFVRIANGHIPNVANSSYIVDTGAAATGRSCTVVLENISGIRNGDIRINGVDVGDQRHIANLIFDKCEFRGCTSPIDAVDLAESTTYFRVTWKNCSKYFVEAGANDYYYTPVPDGYYSSDDWPLDTVIETPGVQAAPVAETGAATITIADIRTGIVTLTQAGGANVNMTLDTGTAMDTGRPEPFGINQYIDWSLINLSTVGGSTGTVVAASDHTLVGNGLVSTTSSGRFRSRRTAANTWISYRMG